MGYIPSGAARDGPQGLTAPLAAVVDGLAIQTAPTIARSSQRTVQLSPFHTRMLLVALWFSLAQVATLASQIFRTRSANSVTAFAAALSSEPTCRRRARGRLRDRRLSQVTDTSPAPRRCSVAGILRGLPTRSRREIDHMKGAHYWPLRRSGHWRCGGCAFCVKCHLCGLRQGQRSEDLFQIYSATFAAASINW